MSTPQAEVEGGVAMAAGQQERGALAWLRRQSGGAPLYPIVALAGLNLVDELDQAAFNLFGPEIIRDFNITAAQFGLLFVPLIMLGMFLPVVVGHLTDRYNRVGLAVFGASAWFMFAFATGLVTAFWALVVVRCFSAIGRGFAGPTHASLLVDYYPPSGRGFAFSLHQNANPVGQFIGLIGGGYLATVIGWQNVFLLLPLPGLLFVLLVLRLKEPARGTHERRELDTETAVPEPPVGLWRSLRLLVGIRSWMRYAWIWLCLGAGVALSSAQPFYFSAVFGVDTFGRGLILGASTVTQFIGAVVAGLVAQRWMARGLHRRTGQIATWSLLFTALAFAGMAVAPTLEVAVAVVVLTMPLRAMAAVPVALIFAEIVPPRIRGQGFGAIWVLFALGFWFMPVALAVGDATSFRVSMLIAAVPMLLAALIAALSVKHISSDIERARETVTSGLERLRRPPARKSSTSLESEG